MTATIEVLEGRTLLAAAPAAFVYSGDVTARVEDGWLVVRGDAAANELRILDYGVPYVYHLMFRGNTSINGKLEDAFIDGVTQGVRVHMGGGGDKLLVSDLGPAPTDAPGAEGAAYAMRIDMGAGDDELEVEGVLAHGRSSVAGGYGNDVLTLTDVRAARDLAVLPGAGHDRTALTRVNVGGKLELDDRQGRAWAGLEGVNVIGRTTVRTGALGDSIVLRDSALGQRARFTTLDGDDHMVVRNTTFATSALIDDGAGVDVMDREVTLAWDFRHGAQGWEAGFADLPDRQDLYEDWGLRSGIAPLPAESGWGGNSFMLSGTNGSDDLLMYLSREVSEVEGLLPNTGYQLSFDVRFATSAPSGSVGLGGPPAENVAFEVGGASQAPAVLPVGHGVSRKLVLNVAGEMSYAGDVSNGLVAGRGRDEFVYRVVRRGLAHEPAVTTDAQGRMWLLVGTDSGFEGVTTLYYVKVKVRLTPIGA